MSYISPITIGSTQQMEEGWADKISKYIAGEVDNLVLESCVKVGCHVDKDELEKALRYDRDQYDKGYADGKLDAASPWRRVEDGLPEKEGFYLVKVSAGIRPIRVFEYKPINNVLPDNQNLWVSEDCCRCFNWFVTHWMPLPEPPKEDA